MLDASCVWPQCPAGSPDVHKSPAQEMAKVVEVVEQPKPELKLQRGAGTGAGAGAAPKRDAGAQRCAGMGGVVMSTCMLEVGRVLCLGLKPTSFQVYSRNTGQSHYDPCQVRHFEALLCS